MLESYAIDLAMQNNSNLILDQIIIYQKAFEKAVANENLKDVIASNRLFYRVYECHILFSRPERQFMTRRKLSTAMFCMTAEMAARF
jgi:DNA-binding GntR family transcriptional regulator